MPMLNKRRRSRTVSRAPKKRKLFPTTLGVGRKVVALDRAAYTKSICVYSDFGRTLNPALASVDSYVYSLNGLYDPDISGVGAQPTGFDQYMALYGKYTVLKARVTISCVNADGTNAQFIGCNIAALSTTSTDANVYLRNNNQYHKYLENATSGAAIGYYSFEVDIDKLVSNNIWTDDSFQGNVGSNPVNQWYLIIWSTAANSSVNVGDTYWTVKIEYLTVFREPINAANS